MFRNLKAKLFLAQNANSQLNTNSERVENVAAELRESDLNQRAKVIPEKMKSDFFNELTMEGLKSFYNRSRIEYDDFRRVFKFKTLDQI